MGHWVGTRFGTSRISVFQDKRGIFGGVPTLFDSDFHRGEINLFGYFTGDAGFRVKIDRRTILDCEIYC